MLFGAENNSYFPMCDLDFVIRRKVAIFAQIVRIRVFYYENYTQREL